MLEKSYAWELTSGNDLHLWKWFIGQVFTWRKARASHNCLQLSSAWKGVCVRARAAACVRHAVCVGAWVHACVRVWVHVWVCVCVCVCVCVSACVCVPGVVKGLSVLKAEERQFDSEIRPDDCLSNDRTMFAAVTLYWKPVSVMVPAGKSYHQVNAHVHQHHIDWTTTFRSGLPQPL